MAQKPSASSARSTKPLPSGLRPWKPGQSGNPKGRAPSTLLEVARVHTQEAIDTILYLMRHAEDENTRLDAAEVMLNRGWGKPAMALAVQAQMQLTATGIDAPPRPIENPEEWLARRRKELAALTIEGVAEAQPETNGERQRPVSELARSERQAPEPSPPPEPPRGWPGDPPDLPGWQPARPRGG